MNASRLIRNLLIAGCFVACLSTVVVAQTTIYSDDFSGTGAALLNGLAPDVRPGTQLWSANNFVNDNGTINGSNEGSAILDFTPALNATYTLSLDVTMPLNVDRWVGVGFAQTALVSPGANRTNDRYANDNRGIAWMLFRDHLTDATQDVQLFGGPGTAGGIADDNNAITYGVPHTLSVILDTTGDGSSFTANFKIDGVSQQTGGSPVTIAQSISVLKYVGFTFDNSTTTPPSVDNFLLTELITGPVVNQWNIDGGGDFSVAGNWTLGTPASGGTVLFGNKLTAPNSPATVVMDTAKSLAEVQFANSVASYNLAGPNILTLTGGHTVSSVGTHTISAVVAGSAGLVKTGAGTLMLTNTNTYTGTTDIQAASWVSRTQEASTATSRWPPVPRSPSLATTWGVVIRALSPGRSPATAMWRWMTVRVSPSPTPRVTLARPFSGITPF